MNTFTHLQLNALECLQITYHSFFRIPNSTKSKNKLVLLSGQKCCKDRSTVPISGLRVEAIYLSLLTSGNSTNNDVFSSASWAFHLMFWQSHQQVLKLHHATTATTNWGIIKSISWDTPLKSWPQNKPYSWFVIVV